MSRRRAPAGFTLVEVLIVVVLLAALAAAAVPALSSLDDQRLGVAAGEVRNALRLARAEALRRGRSVLVDAESTAGHIRLYVTTCSAFGSGSTIVTDPRTKSDFDLDVTGGSFSRGVGVTPRFLAGGSAYGGLVFASDGTASDVCKVSETSSEGSPQSGSQVVLTLGAKQAVVSIDPSTGRVSGP